MLRLSSHLALEDRRAPWIQAKTTTAAAAQGSFDLRMSSMLSE